MASLGTPMPGNNNVLVHQRPMCGHEERICARREAIVVDDDSSVLGPKHIRSLHAADGISSQASDHKYTAVGEVMKRGQVHRKRHWAVITEDRFVGTEPDLTFERTTVCGEREYLVPVRNGGHLGRQNNRQRHHQLTDEKRTANNRPPQFARSFDHGIESSGSPIFAAGPFTDHSSGEHSPTRACAACANKSLPATKPRCFDPNLPGDECPGPDPYPREFRFDPPWFLPITPAPSPGFPAPPAPPLAPAPNEDEFEPVPTAVPTGRGRRKRGAADLVMQDFYEALIDPPGGNDRLANSDATPWTILLAPSGPLPATLGRAARSART